MKTMKSNSGLLLSTFLFITFLFASVSAWADGVALVSGTGVIYSGTNGTVYDLSPSLRGMQSDVWISCRTDGLPGSGTPEDPYDGSTQAKFDGVLGSLNSSAPMAIHLESGTFKTLGVSMNPNWTISGAGMYNTTIQLSRGTGTGTTYVISAAYGGGAGCSGATLSGLTADANWANLTNTGAATPVGGMALVGTNITVKNCRVINTHGNHSLMEEVWGIIISYAPWNTNGVIDNDVIDGCVVENACGDYDDAILIVGGNNNFSATSMPGVIRNCIARNMNTTAAIISIGGTIGGVIENNRIENCTSPGGAFYFEGGIPGTVIRGNVVRNWNGVCGIWMNGPCCNNTIIEDNLIDLSGTTSQGGISIGAATNSQNTIVRDNTITTSGNPSLIQGFSASDINGLVVVGNNFPPSSGAASLNNCPNLYCSGNRTSAGPAPWGLTDTTTTTSLSDLLQDHYYAYTPAPSDFTTFFTGGGTWFTTLGNYLQLRTFNTGDAAGYSCNSPIAQSLGLGGYYEFYDSYDVSILLALDNNPYLRVQVSSTVSTNDLTASQLGWGVVLNGTNSYFETADGSTHRTLAFSDTYSHSIQKCTLRIKTNTPSAGMYTLLINGTVIGALQGPYVGGVGNVKWLFNCVNTINSYQGVSFLRCSVVQ